MNKLKLNQKDATNQVKVNVLNDSLQFKTPLFCLDGTRNRSCTESKNSDLGRNRMATIK